ncbi:hypothetical protein PR003_g23135 [Phytophthora rubi]|uniref:Uncharacterized protein n=1 Tax=Phytophthora rubi TaxID=129364 RepID=A0A6A4CYS6_9STRA|nr:hypothetical protein PR001_g21989 [Phytophthora rubi]KAE9298819.1 hypothetical protein PR003_g23135 [Phytophthora rubi]
MAPSVAERGESTKPTDAIFEKAERAFLDPDRDERDKRCAALAGVPQQVSPELCFSTWIPARDLTVSFSDTEIMTSLDSTPQSPLWSKSLEHLRDFKAVPRAGISFVCTDREVCTKQGGEAVTICGRKFTVQAHSKYSHWYYVDLQRLPDDVSDGTIYDWSRRVYFNQKSAPASVMIDKRTPLRQIQFLGHGYSVVHHRRREFNRVIPPFIKELRDKHKKTAEPQPDPPSQDAEDAASTPPAYDDQSDTSENAAMADASDSDFEPHSGDESESDSSHDDSMDGIEVAIKVHRKAIWPSGNPVPRRSHQVL